MKDKNNKCGWNRRRKVNFEMKNIFPLFELYDDELKEHFKTRKGIEIYNY